MKFYEKTTLENGIRVLTQETNSIKSFTLGIWVNVGSRDEESKLNGLSHFIEHCVFKGTKNRTAKEIASSIEGLGAYLNAYTSKEHTCFYVRGLSDNFVKSFEILADLVKNPIFPEDEIEKEKQVILEEYYSINDDPDDIIFDLIEGELFKGHGLANPIIGNENNILSFNSETTKSFIQKNYSADRIIVATAGPIPHQLVVEKARELLGDIPQLNSNLNRTNPDLKNHQVVKEEYRDINQVHICIARKTFGVKDERRSALAILNTLIGGMTSSRLFQLIREEQALAYNTSSFINNYYDASVFGVYLSTSLANREKVIDLIQKEFRSVCEHGIKDDELEVARNYLKGGISMSLESTSSKSTHLAVNEFYFGEAKSIEEIFASIDKVGKKELQALANEILCWEEFSIYQIVPKKGGNNGN
ncbi:MAG: insulinase family protein [Ignavibacteria bacterium]|nr:insulinase family protein [Ignavibacteria bacterium]